MYNKNRYQRIFLIFSPEDKGFGSGQEPSGYVRIEISNGKGKLLASVQSLRKLDRLVYNLYLIRSTGDIVIPVRVGTIQLQNNRAELKWDFNPEDVANTGLAIKDFNVAAIIGESKDSNIDEFVCPIAAYRDGKVSWRSNISRLIKQAQAGTEKKAPLHELDVQDNSVDQEKEKKSENAEDDITSKYERDIYSKYEPSENTPHLESIYSGKAAPGKEPETYMDSIEKASDEIQGGSDDIKPEIDYTAPSQEQLAEIPDGMGFNKPEEAEHIENEFNTDNSYNAAYQKTGFCMPNKTKSTANPCENCTMNSAHNLQREYQNEGNIAELRQYFDKFFENYDPFRSRRKDYKWWKVGSPVQLNNVMYQCNIKTPLLFNPAVMMAHFKYRHLIVGIYTDQVRKREFIVCGVPGIHRVDDKPFGDLCRWVQIEGNRPRYGAFGYWLVYIDGKSGKLLNIS